MIYCKVDKRFYKYTMIGKANSRTIIKGKQP